MRFDLIDLEALFVVAGVAGGSLLAWRAMVAAGHRRAHRSTAALLKAHPPAGKPAEDPTTRDASGARG